VRPLFREMKVQLSILAFYLLLQGGVKVFSLNLWGKAPPHNESDYGVDFSFPIHHYLDRKKAPIGYQRYENLMKGCYKKYSPRECDATERARIDMNMEQPRTQHNYTELGFKKLKAPIAAWEPLLAFYEQNKHNAKPENWPRGNTYVNHWESPTEMVSFEDRQLRGGMQVKQKIWDGVRPIIEEWTGHKLEPTSLYGIRIYRDGAMLATHVDRLPLISSCIIQVAQDLDEPWPIEVYSHDGKAYNVTMQPGEMVLYESHTVLHGRPFPLKGRTYANVFVHFQPVDHEQMQAQDREERLHPHAVKKAPSAATLLTPPAAASSGGGSSKSASVFDRFLGSGGGGSRTVANNKKTPNDIGGHEQSNHEDEHLQKHLEAIDKENADAEAAAAVMAKTSLQEEKADSKLDNKIEAIKNAVEHREAQLEEARARRGPSAVNADLETESTPPKVDEEPRFKRGFTDVDELHNTNAERLDDTPAGGGEAEGAEGGEDQPPPSSGDPILDAIRDASAQADLEALRSLFAGLDNDEARKSYIEAKDENDWQLLHEAVRSGDLAVVKLLVDLGADLNSRVAGGGGALWVARNYLDPNHAVTNFLLEIGAPELTPEDNNNL